MAVYSAELFYPIADSVQASLSIDRTSKKVSGGCTKEIGCFHHATLSVPLTAVSHFSNEKKGQVGVLFKSLGDLYVLSAFNTQHKVVTLFLINGKALGKESAKIIKDIPGDATIKEAHKILEKGIKKSFYRRSTESTWTEFKAQE